MEDKDKMITDVVDEFTAWKEGIGYKMAWFILGFLVIYFINERFQLMPEIFVYVISIIAFLVFWYIKYVLYKRVFRQRMDVWFSKKYGKGK